MKTIHCNIYGDYDISDLAVMILNTKEFQRLHYIKQTSCSYKIFPTSIHTRLEHCLGTYHITDVLLTHLLNVQPELDSEVTPRIKELIMISGLVHDLGHFAFSHMDRHVLPILEKKYDIDVGRWKHHEYRSIDIFKHIVNKYEIPLDEHEVDFITECIEPTDGNTLWYQNIVNNTINGLDVDKLDYIQRDIRAYGSHIDTLDVYRIITNSRVIDGELCYCYNVRGEIFSLYMARYTLFKELLVNPKILIFELMMRDIIIDLAERYDILGWLVNQDCENYCSFMRDDKITAFANADLLEAYDSRQCYKFIYSDQLEGMDNETKEQLESVTVTCSFIGNGKDPFQSIKYYSRKDPTTIINVNPEDINMLLTCNDGEPSYKCSQKYTYHYKRIY